MVILILFSFTDEYILKFAEELEQQGDYFRAITEYKRCLYQQPKADSIRYRIASIYGKNGRYRNAVDILRDVRNKDENYHYTMGNLFYKAEYYDSCKKYWNGKLLGLVYLREGDMKSGIELLQLEEFPRLKNPLVGVALSAVLPGTGRIYADRWGDGIFSMITISISSFYAYKYYKEENYLMSGLFGGLALGFYGGNIYGSYISVKVYNSYILDKYIGKVEEWLLH